MERRKGGENGSLPIPVLQGKQWGICSQKISLSHWLTSGLEVNAVNSTPDIPSPLPSLYLEFPNRIPIVLVEISLSFLQPKGMNQNWSKTVIVIPFPTTSDWFQDGHVNQFQTMRLKGKICWEVSLSRKKNKTKRQAQLGKGFGPSLFLPFYLERQNKRYNASGDAAAVLQP